jgi:hypothetical protein
MTSPAKTDIKHWASKVRMMWLTYADFLAYGVGDRSSVSAARREAVALGFVRFKPGRGGNREFRRPDLFGLTFTAIDPTHEWRKVETLNEAWAIADSARKAKDPNAVAVGRERARRRAERQKASPEKPQVSVRENQTETNRSPVRKNQTTVSEGKTGPLSIVGDGARSAPARSLASDDTEHRSLVDSAVTLLVENALK